jgi:subtilisin
MKKILAVSLILGLMLATVGLVIAQNQDEDQRYLVKSNNGVLKIMYGVQHNFNNGFTTDLSPGQLRVLEKFGVGVEEVELYHITAPPGACSPWPECRDSEEPPVEERTCYPITQKPYGIVMVNGGTGGAGINVAVLDTGVYKDHLDLDVKMCKDATKRGIKNGCADRNGHGTHVAGANIISMSLGGDAESSLIRDAIDYATDNDVLVIAAAGNDGPADGSIDYPSANAKVVAVGAIDSAENVPSFSSRGINDGDYVVELREVEIGAPGVNVESTWKDGCYNTISGTSMATPHVSGFAAKLWQGNSVDTRTYLQERARLHDLHTEGDDTATGFGLPIAQ